MLQTRPGVGNIIRERQADCPPISVSPAAFPWVSVPVETAHPSAMYTVEIALFSVFKSQGTNRRPVHLWGLDHTRTSLCIHLLLLVVKTVRLAPAGWEHRLAGTQAHRGPTAQKSPFTATAHLSQERRKKTYQPLKKINSLCLAMESGIYWFKARPMRHANFHVT